MLKSKNENYDTCKLIAEKIELYASGSAYKCSHCGEVHEMTAYEETEHENESGETCYTCPNCGEDIEASELEAVSIYDYFDSDIFDIEYRIDGNKQYKTVSVMIACGGPNIYIDTQRKAVILRWWTDSADYSLSFEACEAIDAFFEDTFYC